MVVDAEHDRVVVAIMRGDRTGKRYQLTDRVTVQVAKSPQALWLYLGCLRGGFVFHPLNDAYRDEEIARPVRGIERPC